MSDNQTPGQETSNARRDAIYDNYIAELDSSVKGKNNETETHRVIVEQQNSNLNSIKSKVENKTASDEDIKKCGELITKQNGITDYKIDSELQKTLLEGSSTEEVSEVIRILQEALTKIPENDVMNRGAIAEMIRMLEAIPTPFKEAGQSIEHKTAPQNISTGNSSSSKKTRKPIIKKEKPSKKVDEAAINAQKIIIELDNKYKQILTEIKALDKGAVISKDRLRKVIVNTTEFREEVENAFTGIPKDKSLPNNLLEQVYSIERFLKLKSDVIILIERDPVKYGKEGKNILENLITLFDTNTKNILTNVGILGLEIIYYQNIIYLQKFKEEVYRIEKIWEEDSSNDFDTKELCFFLKNIARPEMTREKYMIRWNKYCEGRSKIDDDEKYLNNSVLAYYFQRYLQVILFEVQKNKNIETLVVFLSDLREEVKGMTDEFHTIMSKTLTDIEKCVDIIGRSLKT